MQTSITENPAAYQSGAIADSAFARDIVSRHVVVNGDAGANPGLAVMRLVGTDDIDGCRQGHTVITAIAFEGVAMLDTSLEQADPLYADTETVPVVRKGRIAVTVEEAVSDGDDVYFRVVAAGAEEAGAFRVSADGTDTIQISAGARWVSETAGAGIAVLEINLP